MDDQRELTEGAVPAAQRGREATIAGSPASPDHEGVSSRGFVRRDESEPALDLWHLLDAAEQEFLASDEPCDRKTALARAVLEGGWRPPLPKQDARLLRSLVAGVIDGHFGDDYREQAEAAAQEIIDRGWLDKTGAVGQPEPVATTLRRIIRDLEEQAAGPQQHTHAGIALSQYADRLRGHPALDGDADAGWPPLPEVMHDAGETAEEAVRRLAAEVAGLRQQRDHETEWGIRVRGEENAEELGSEQWARATVQGDPGYELVQRHAAGPWIEVQP